MTNREKFEEVFGLDIADRSICHIVNRSTCENNICDEGCPAFKFWDGEWKEKKNEKMD